MGEETQRLVERDRFLHRWQRVEPDTFVLEDTRLVDNRARELAAKRPATKLRADEGVDSSPRSLSPILRSAACQFLILESQEQAAAERRVISGKHCQLVVEALKTEVDVERCGVFPEESPRFVDLFARCNLD
jgi:hypothetical protein